MPPGASTRLMCSVELGGGERPRGQGPGEDVADDEVAGVRGERLGDLAGLPHAQPQQRRLGQVEPAADVLGQLAVQLHHHLPGIRVGGVEVPGQGAGAAAEVQAPDPARLACPGRSVRRRPAGLDQRGHPAHVLEVEEQRIGEVDVGAHDAVDLQEPAVGVVLVGDQLAVAGIDVVDALHRAVGPGALGHLHDARCRTLAAPAA